MLNMILKLKPSQQINRRYLLLEATSRKEIETAILDYIGILGWAKAAPLFVEANQGREKFILAIDRKLLNEVRAAFELSSSVIKLKRVSGTLKGLLRDAENKKV